MGNYLNPGNSGFSNMRNDKTNQSNNQHATKSDMY